jgi:uncharacterized protein YacL
MITEIILTIIIAILLAFLGYTQYIHIQEREKLLKMFMAKDLREITDNEVISKTKEPLPFKAPDSVSMDDVIEDDVLFDRHLAAVKKQAQEEFNKEQDKI